MVDWSAVVTTVGSTTTIVAIIGYFGKGIVDHALSRSLELQKANLKRHGDQFIESFKIEAQRALQSEQATFAREIERMKDQLVTEAKRQDHIRAEVRTWANPILGAVRDLRFRLDNVIDDEAYPQLSPSVPSNPSWSISYDYFLPSTIYYFCQYFCWIRLLEEQLSFELFEKHAVKDEFFTHVRAVAKCLSSYPAARLRLASAPDDRQIFTLQQRALGELVMVDGEDRRRCMYYRDFLRHWGDDAFRTELTPLISMIEGVHPQTLRWARLDIMREQLSALESHCQALLELPQATEA